MTGENIKRYIGVTTLAVIRFMPGTAISKPTSIPTQGRNHTIAHGKDALVSFPDLMC